MMRTRRSANGAVATAAAGALLLGACGGGGGDGDSVSITVLVDNAEAAVLSAEALIEAFTAAHPDIDVTLETRPGGTEGDNLVKTRLSTGDMPDAFLYNAGSLFQAINPAQNLVDLTDEPFVTGVDESFVDAVSIDGRIYGAPAGPLEAGGVVYHVPTYEELDLEVPLTWDEFMANNEAIAAAGAAAPVIQTYQETFTSQIVVLADFHNVAAADPSFAETYTANQTSYASNAAALRSFEKLEELAEADVYNEDFASASMDDGIRMVATGEGVHYPMLTGIVPTIVDTYPDHVDDVGFFALPGDDPATNGATVWLPGAWYVPTTTEGEELGAAREWVNFVASVEGAEARVDAVGATGPSLIEGFELPDDVPRLVEDLQGYVDSGAMSPALEFLSPVKGPSLEQITVEVGSGIRSAADGAALYDEDVKKQAQQLNLEGW